MKVQKNSVLHAEKKYSLNALVCHLCELSLINKQFPYCVQSA
jgi:hypothetical protein